MARTTYEQEAEAITSGKIGAPVNTRKNKLDQFDEQLQGLVNGERMRAYGHPADHFQASAKIKKILRDLFPMGHDEIDGDERLLHVLDMIADKMVRICHSHEHLDSWIDIAGYARTAVMVIDNLENRDVDPEPEPEQGRYYQVDDAVRDAMPQASEFLPSFRGR